MDGKRIPCRRVGGRHRKITPTVSDVVFVYNDQITTAVAT